MTFLNPLVLFGLAAAAIPILLHLLNLRKLKTVDFSTLRFLRELQRTRMRKVRLRQWILLLLRTLLIVFLVLAFSRPTLKGSFPGLKTAGARSTLILVLDDSPSMGLRNTGGVIFDQAREAIRDLLPLVQTGDELHLVRLSTATDSDTTGTLWSTEGISEALGPLPLSNRSYPYAAAFQKALKIAERSPAVNREIYLLTDLQGSHFALPPGADTISGPAPRARVFLVGFPQHSTANASVTSCAVESRILAQNRPMTVSATVRNWGDRPVQKSVVSLYLDGVRVAQQSVDLAPRGSSSITLTAVPKRRGILGGSVRLEDDVLEIDNSRYFTAAIPETLGILLAGGTAEETRYAALALTLAGDSSVAGLFRIQRITDNQLAYTDLQRYDVLLLAAVRTLPPPLAARIVAAVQQGKGLMVFPGPSMNAQEVNAGLLGPLGIPPLTLPAPAAAATETGGFVRFEKIDFTHPVFSGMFEREPTASGGSPSIESPRIRAAATLPSAGAGLTLVSLTDGRPFLREYRPGAGRVIVSAVDAGVAWSDVAVRGIFAPLLHRSVLYLAATRQARQDAVIGDRLTLQIPPPPGGGQRGYVLLSPSGVEEKLSPQTRSASGVLAFTSQPAEEPGLYRLRYADSPPVRDAALLQAVPVHPDARESDLQPATDDLLGTFWKRHGIPDQNISALDPGGSLQREVEETRHGVELWQVFLVLALLCALLEMLVARISGSAVPGEMQHA